MRGKVLEFAKKYHRTFWSCLLAASASAGVVFLQLPLMDGGTRFARDTEAGSTAQIATLEVGKYIGFENVTASVLWLSFIQYFGDATRLRSGYFLNPVYLEAIANSDPHFLHTYAIATSAIAIRSGQPERARDLLEFGMEHVTPEWNDRAYRIPYSLATVNFLYFGDGEAARDAYYQAADWYEISTQESAQNWRDIGDRIYAKPESRFLQFRVWSHLLQLTQDPESQENILQRLNDLGEVRQLPDGTLELIPPPNDLI